MRGADTPSEVSVESVLALAGAIAVERGGEMNTGDLLAAVYQMEYAEVFEKFMAEVTVDQLKQKLKELSVA